MTFVAGLRSVLYIVSAGLDLINELRCHASTAVFVVNVTPCSLVARYQRSGGMSRPHLGRPEGGLVGSSETLASLIRRHIPADA
jgi:hypothetical protein